MVMKSHYDPAQQRLKREQLYNKIPCFLPDTEDHEYALYDVMPITEERVSALRLASERITAIFFKVTALLQTVHPNVLCDMGYPIETINFVRMKTLPVPTVIARIDLIPSGNSFKCIEINADTSTFLKEAYSVNGAVCEHFGLRDPNEGLLSYLEKAVNLAVRTNKYASFPNIVFTACANSREDVHTTLLLQDSVGGARFVPFEQLKIVKGEGVYDDTGKKVDILYRPTGFIEYMLKEKDSEKNPIGLWLIELVLSKKLFIINPPSAFLMENKAVMSVIWGLHEENAFFTEEEHEWIEEYFLPSYLEADTFLANNEPYVEKSIFASEGATVKILDGKGNTLAQSKHENPSEYLLFYQKYVEQPKVTIHTNQGEQEVHYLFCSFIINGTVGAIGCRADATLTENDAFFLPIGIKS